MIEPTLHRAGDEILHRPPAIFPTRGGAPKPLKSPRAEEFEPIDVTQHREAPGISNESVEEDRFREDLRKEVEELNEIAKDLGHRFSYDVYEETEEFFVRVFDRRTNELLKMIPPEKVLDLRARIQDAVGTILDEEA